MRLTFDNAIISSTFDDEEQFEGFKSLMFEAGKNEFSESSMTLAKANKKIAEVFAEMTGLEAGKKYSRTEIRRAIRRMSNDPVCFDLIEEVLDDIITTGWEENPWFNEFVEKRNLALGDLPTFVTEDDTILAVEKVAGNHHDLRRQRLGVGTAVTPATAWYGVKVYAEFERILTGQEDWSKLVAKVGEAFVKYVVDFTYSAIQQAVTRMSTEAKFHNSGSLSYNNVIALAGEVEAVNDGCEVIIMGTKAALANLYAIAPVQWISNEMMQERNQTGKLGIWQGYRLVEIPNRYTDKSLTTKLAKDDQIMFIPVSADNKLVAMVDEGDGVVTEINDQAHHMDMTYDYEYQRKMGFALLLRRKFGVWDQIV